MHFRPLHDRVLVRRIEAEEKTAGGIIIPDTAKEKPMEGEVVAVGPGARDDAGKLVQTLLEGFGNGGGHAHRAGGKIPDVTTGRITESLEKELRHRWLQACEVDCERGARLVARRTILENL